MNATQQKFKPILFSTEMVQAILAGRKTQTRRIIKSRHESGLFHVCKDFEGNITSINSLDWDEANCEKDVLPKYQPGDILWVRENWQLIYELERFDDERIAITDIIKNWNKISHTELGNSTGHQRNNESSRMSYAVYKADNIEYTDPENKLKWRPSIHMPKEAARIFLKVTNVRVERLHDISEADAAAEGATKGIFRYGPRGYPNNEFQLEHNNHGSYIAGFKYIWHDINGGSSWDSNPWVWVYEFERIEKPENFI